MGLVALLLSSGCAWVGGQSRATLEGDTDARVESEGSSADAAVPLVGRSILIGVLPVENLSGGRAPLEVVDRSLRIKLKETGVRIVDDSVIEEFMKRYRIRNTGSLDSRALRAIREETGAEAVLLTSLETYRDTIPPKVSFMFRLVSSGERPQILWMLGVGLSGEDSPGFLGLGLIEETEVLLDEALRDFVDSLARCLLKGEGTIRDSSADDLRGCAGRAGGRASSRRGRAKRRYRPRTSFRSQIIDTDQRYSVAVIPFLNSSERRNAGRIVTLHLVNELFRNERFAVIEPGLVREQLLRYRIVMQAGPSFANAQLLSSDSSLGADLVLSGAVFDYQDAVGTPKVDFSVSIIEKQSGQVVWTSRSYNHGDEGVFFFDFGRLRTAHRLTAEMAKGTCEVLAR